MDDEVRKKVRLIVFESDSDSDSFQINMCINGNKWFAYFSQCPETHAKYRDCASASGSMKNQRQFSFFSSRIGMSK